VTRLRIAAAYQVTAGLIGLNFIFHLHGIQNGRAVTFNIIALGLACLSMLLGVLLWTGAPRARAISLGFQLMQVPRLASSVIILGLLIGVEGSVRFEGPLVSLFTTTGVTLNVLRPFAPQSQLWESTLSQRSLPAYFGDLLRTTGREISTGPANER
jgi:hypothetical protein